MILAAETRERRAAAVRRVEESELRSLMVAAGSECRRRALSGGYVTTAIAVLCSPIVFLSIFYRRYDPSTVRRLSRGSNRRNGGMDVVTVEVGGCQGVG